MAMSSPVSRTQSRGDQETEAVVAEPSSFHSIVDGRDTAGLEQILAQAETRQSVQVIAGQQEGGLELGVGFDAAHLDLGIAAQLLGDQHQGPDLGAGAEAPELGLPGGVAQRTQRPDRPDCRSGSR